MGLNSLDVPMADKVRQSRTQLVSHLCDTQGVRISQSATAQLPKTCAGRGSALNHCPASPQQTEALATAAVRAASKLRAALIAVSAALSSPATPLPHTQTEALATAAVRAATKLRAALIIVFTVTGRTARLIAKYRPQQPILTVSRLSSENLKVCGWQL